MNLTLVSGFFRSRRVAPRATRFRRGGREVSVTLRIRLATVSNRRAPAPRAWASPFPRCPSLSHSPSGPAQTPRPGRPGRHRTAASRSGVNCGDGRQEACTVLLRRHRDNRNATNAATTATAATLVAGTGNDWRKGGGRRRGGERRPRARSGPGGGGRLRPFVSLSAKCPRMRPPVPVSLLLVAYPPQVPVAASAQSNYNICRRV